MNWTYLAGDKDKRRALANTKMNLQIPRTAKNFLTAKILHGSVHTSTSSNMFYAVNLIVVLVGVRIYFQNLRGLNVTKICKTEPASDAYVGL